MYLRTMVGLTRCCLGMVALLASGSAWAQPSSSPPPAPAPLRVAATTSPQQKLTFGASSDEEIHTADRTVSRLVEAARRDGNEKALACLVPRQTAVQALASVSQSSLASLEAAVDTGQSAKADLEFRKLAVAVSKTRMLVAESQRCVTDRNAQLGTTVVDWASALREVDLLGEEAIDALEIGVDPPQVTPFL